MAAAPFVLVHGAWHGAWSWDELAPLLRQAGHHVEAPDLPGHGALAATPVAECTPDANAAVVVAALERARAAAGGAPAVLIGHSLGGMSVAAACEARPDLVRHAAYVCAYLPGDGESAYQLALRDPDSAITPDCCRVLRDEGLLVVDGERIAPALYGDVPAADMSRAAARLVPEPLAPMGAPARLTPERHGAVPRTYVLCTRDQILTPAFQRELAAAGAGTPVLVLESGHSPMLERPADLAALLLPLARG